MRRPLCKALPGTLGTSLVPCGVQKLVFGSWTVPALGFGPLRWHAAPLFGTGIVRGQCLMSQADSSARRAPGPGSSSAFVLVDDPTEDVVAADRPEMLWPRHGFWRVQV